MAKSEKRIREKVVPVRFSEEERARLLEGAEEAGLSVGAFIRKRALGDPGERFRKRPPADRQELTRLLAQLGKVGGNINQIARRINSGDQPPDLSIEKASEAVVETLAAIRKAILK